MSGPPPPATETVAGAAGLNQSTAKEMTPQKETSQEQSTAENRVAPQAPPTQEELHQKFDVTKEEVTKAGQSVKQYERYQVVAKADEVYADEHPMNQAARAKAGRSEAFAEKYYAKNVEPFEKKMMGPNGKPKDNLEYEPGASPEDAKKFAMRSSIDHKVEPSVTQDNDHIRVGNGGTFSSQEIPGMRAEMLRDEARDKARDAVSQNPDRGHSKHAAGPAL